MDRQVLGTQVPGALAALDRQAPVLPEFGTRCITEIVPTLLGSKSTPTTVDWVPSEVLSAPQIVLFVIDGLGWQQLEAHRSSLPSIGSLMGCPITSVLPTTTATALTSIATGTVPAKHGVVGYRMRMGDDVLNVLRWTTAKGDVRQSLPPQTFRRIAPFLGTAPPVVSRAEFEGTGFTEAHLGGAHLVGWRMPSSIVLETKQLVADGVPFVYVYYDGVDKVAHEKGLGEYYLAELVALDRIVGDLLGVLPSNVALCVTADHGQVEVLRPPIVLPDVIMTDVTMLSGEGRFRWLHVVPGATDSVRDACSALYSDVAWVKTHDEIIEDGWFGGPLDASIQARLGDVALLAREPVAFFDPNDTGELRLVARHGSATAAEVLVPFLSYVS